MLNIISKLKLFDETDLIKYLNSQDINYLDELCRGNKIIPTPDIFDNILFINNTIEIDYPEIYQYVEQLKNTSHSFYNNLADIIQSTWRQGASFEQQFEQKVKPHGQKFINNLKAVRYKVGAAKIDDPDLLIKKSTSCMVDSCKKNIKFSFVKKRILHLRKMLAFYPHITYKIYIVVATALVIMAGFGGFHFAINVNLVEKATLIGAITSIIILVIAVANYTAHFFEHVDIAGRNILAYNYKLLFNNLTKQ